MSTSRSALTVEPGKLVVLIQIVGLGAPALIGHERGGLDIEQRGSHKQKIARHIEVDLVHAVNLGQILLCDLRDRDSADINLLARDELEQQVKGAGIARRGNAI